MTPLMRHSSLLMSMSIILKTVQELKQRKTVRYSFPYLLYV